MTYIQPKEYCGCIVVDANFVKNDEFMHWIKEAYKCEEHRAKYAFGDEHYKLYRRGKNRCKRCGVKIES